MPVLLTYAYWTIFICLCLACFVTFRLIFIVVDGGIEGPGCEAPGY